MTSQRQQQIEQADDIIRLGLTDTQQKSPVKGEPAGLPICVFPSQKDKLPTAALDFLSPLQAFLYHRINIVTPTGKGLLSNFSQGHNVFGTVIWTASPRTKGLEDTLKQIRLGLKGGEATPVPEPASQ